MSRFTLFALGVIYAITALDARRHPRTEALQSRKDFNTLWDKSLAQGASERDQLRGPRRQGHRMEDLLTDGTKTERFKLFQASRTRIQALRAERGEDKFKMGENFFAMMTDDEKKGYLGVNMTHMTETKTKWSSQPQVKGSDEEGGMMRPPLPRGRMGPAAGRVRSKRTEEESLDWRDHGAVTPVKNQGTCGSCWAFGAIATVESSYFIATGNLKNFSEQQVIDCNSAYGCSGGWWPTVWDDIKDDNFVALLEDTPYEGAKTADDCSRDNTNGLEGAQLTGYKVMRESDAESSMLTNLGSYGPVAICIYVDDTVYYYESGSIDSCLGDNCNHLVTLVGYDADSLLIKNSWGTSWGIDGYLKLDRGCADDGYSYWASFPYLEADADESTDDDSTSDDTDDTTNDDAEEEEEDTSCVDTYTSYCPTWQGLGYCEDGSVYQSWMETNCPSSCGVC